MLTYSVPLRRSKTYRYDGDGLMTSRTGAGTISFVWDHSGGLSLMLGDGTNRYVYGPGETPLEQIDGSGVVTYLHHDAIGSTRMLTEARGAATATFSYTPYGALSGSTGTQTTWFGFAGQYTEREAGIQYLRARFYDPATGQFLTRDPLGPMAGVPYGYANDSPVNYTDPSGQFPGLGEIGMFISEFDAATLNYLSFGLTNWIAGVDGSCGGAGYQWGNAFAPFLGAMIPGEGELEAAAGAERAAVSGVEHGRETLGFDPVERNYVSRTQPKFSVHLDMDPERHGGPHFDIHRRADAFGPKQKIRWPMDQPWKFPG